jgi:hypothetical protein
MLAWRQREAERNRTVWMRLRGQSLVELALVAPILITLLVIVLDLGRIFVVWITVTNSAREAAYFGSRAIAGGIPATAIRGVAALEGGGTQVLPDATYVTIAYPSPDMIAVTVRSPFQPVAPMVGALWAGGSPWISAKAAFPAPIATATPLPITPSTPVPSATPTSATTPTAATTATSTAASTGTVTPSPTRTSTLASTPTGTQLPTSTPTRTATTSPTRTATRTATPGLCTETITIPPLTNNQGYWVTITTNGSGAVSATWLLSSRNNIEIDLYAGNPFSGQSNPAAISPPSGELTTATGNLISLTMNSPGPHSAGTYTVYFFNRGSLIASSSTATIIYVKATCP